MVLSTKISPMYRPRDVEELHAHPAHLSHPVRYPGPGHRHPMPYDQEVRQREHQQVPRRQRAERRRLRHQTHGGF